MRRFTALLTLLLSLSASLAHAQTHPNIILILTDDEDTVGWQDALAHGLLPHIKTRLVDAGWNADNAFVPLSACCPARAMLEMGQYAHNTHVIGNAGTNGILALDEAHALPTWLQVAGYNTAHAGKYLNEYGILGNAGLATDPQSAKHVPPGWSLWQGLNDNYTYTGFDHHWTSSLAGGAPTFVTDTAYQTDIVSYRFLGAVSLLIDAGAPFYAQMTPATPHFHLTAGTAPLAFVSSCTPTTKWSLIGTTAARWLNTVNLPLPMSPAFNAGKAGKPAPIPSQPAMTATDIDCARKTYNRRIEQMRGVDDSVGALFALLDTKGQTSHTIVCLASDNGHMLGEFGLVEKLWAYERSIRVPLVCAGPGIVARHSSTLVALPDLPATFADWAGATPTVTLDGRSLRSEMANTAPLVRYAFPLLAAPAVNDGAPIDAVPMPSGPFFGVRTPTRKAIFYVSGPNELYHLDTDPYELVNLATDPTWAAELNALLLVSVDLITCSGATCTAVETVVRP